MLRLVRTFCNEQIRLRKSWERTAESRTTRPVCMRSPLGSYIVFLNQPQRQNVLTLFEPQIYPNRLDALGEAERPYDVAGWTLPLQMGVEAPGVMAINETAAERRLTLIRDPNEVRTDLALPLANGDCFADCQSSQNACAHRHLQILDWKHGRRLDTFCFRHFQCALHLHHR